MNVRRNGGEVAKATSASSSLLTAAEFQDLAEVPPEVEWFANIENDNTRRAYPPM